LFRRSRYLTTADFFERRLSRGLGLLYAIMGVLIFSVNTGTMLKGTGTIATSVTGGRVPEWAAILVMTIGFVAYGTAGGLIATVVTESVQGLLIVVMSLMLVPFGLHAVGGFAGLHHLLTPDKFTLAAPQELTLPWILAAFLSGLIGIVAQPHTMEVCAAGKTEWEGRVGFTYGSFVKRFCAMGWALTGLLVLAMVANGTLGGPLAKREEAFGVAIRTLLPPGMTGLMFAAILAAQMSTLSAFMVAGSALLSRNLYRGWWRPQAGDEATLRVGRYAGLVVVALGVAFAFTVPGVADALTWFWALNSLMGLLIWVSFGVMAVIWVVLGPLGAKLAWLHPGGVLGVYGDKMRLHLLLLSYLPAGAVALVTGSLASVPGRLRRGAWAAPAVAAGAWALSGLMPPASGPWSEVVQVLPYALGQAFAAGLVGLVVGRLVQRPVPEEALRLFRLLLRTPVGREAELAGLEVVYAGESEGHPWELEHPRLVNVGGFLVALAVSVAILLVVWGLGRMAA
ncbi:MAG: hypothetical protein HYU66_15545, partial [Armatimonadetes bacterium]|nr:hypothetical protein [Armatimonadota bacterium]